MKLIIATHNQHKVEEFSRILTPLGIEIAEAIISEAEETGVTFAENAYIKAKSACLETGLPAIADDSGLCVDFLHGEPGIYSARYAAPGFRKAVLLEKMRNVPQELRTAHFVSAISCVFPNGDVLSAQGECTGKITCELRGENGFGYDPIFAVGEKTFGQM
ncbi:MAG: RdgB/HAM1 family non-canonical purine NTP pyrophosphatase, partial [Oscillospiraceae bacterium]